MVWPQGKEDGWTQPARGGQSRGSVFALQHSFERTAKSKQIPHLSSRGIRGIADYEKSFDTACNSSLTIPTCQINIAEV